MVTSRLSPLPMSFFILSLLVHPLYAQAEPRLPIERSDNAEHYEEEPALPSGLAPADDEKATAEPALPRGLRAEEHLPEMGDKIQGKRIFPFDVTGFWEVRAGLRTQEDRYERDASLGETRLQVEIEKAGTTVTPKLVVDFLYDPVFDRHKVKPDKGWGWVDVREMSLSLTPTDFMDIKAGRQILTWGTGDLLFINDLFPKDWNSFFIGRHEEYLKAPSDALKISLFSALANMDIVYTPSFDADRFIDGRRISFWNEKLGRRSGRDSPVHTERPHSWFDDGEIAVRLYRNIRGFELAFYGYRGFWKSPAGMDRVSGKATFPDLIVYGASVRGTVGTGVGNMEIGYYDSEDDRSGSDPFVRNGELRVLVGYEKELAKEFTASAQYYLEHMTDHGSYRRTVPPGSEGRDENRQVLTLRLTKLLLSQNLTLSLFTYYSPTDNDAYLRPNIHYKIDDHWSVEIGGNVFLGKDDHTFFGQLEKNTNLYGGLRYGF